MGNYIKFVKVNILNGVLSGTMEFVPGLNIISGENGTLKTKLLQFIKSNSQSTTYVGSAIEAVITVASMTGVTQHDTAPIPVGLTPVPLGFIRTLAISPKRNAERRSIESVIQFFRQNNRNIDTIISERGSAQINDQTFDAYASAGELYYAMYERRCRDGGNQRDKMNEVTAEFNYVIKSIFRDYELVSAWSDVTGAPQISLIKRGVLPVPIEALSLGEQEILSLTLNLYASKDSYDVFLIDEPEVHLNWHLEEELFDYLEQFCETYHKQVIVVTHSRAIFKSKFLKIAQFLFWDGNGKVAWGKELTGEQRRRIAGEAIEIIKLGSFTKPTFFVEDRSHREVVEEIARTLGTQVPISECGNSTNVKSLYKLSKSEGGWNDATFLVDGDNEGNPFIGESQFIHLDKYCIENYLLDLDIASRVTEKTAEEIKQIIFECIVAKRDKILSKNKYFDFLFDRMKIDDLTPSLLSKFDASIIFDCYIQKIGITRQKYLTDYIVTSQQDGKLSSIFPVRLIEAIEKAATAVVVEDTSINQSDQDKSLEW